LVIADIGANLRDGYTGVSELMFSTLVDKTKNI